MAEGVELSRLDGRIRVLIVEDEALYRDLLRTALREDDSMEVVGAFGDVASALREAAELSPDVAILDIELGNGQNGIHLGRALRRTMPGLGIVLLSNHANPEFLLSVPKRTITGWSYLLKKSVEDVATLKRAIEGAAAGLVVIDPQFAAEAHVGGRLLQLTDRQQEVLALVAQGFTNAVIADKLVLSTKTVDNQLNAIYQRLPIAGAEDGLHPRVAAVLAYLEETS